MAPLLAGGLWCGAVAQPEDRCATQAASASGLPPLSSSAWRPHALGWLARVRNGEEKKERAARSRRKGLTHLCDDKPVQRQAGQ